MRALLFFILMTTGSAHAAAGKWHAPDEAEMGRRLLEAAQLQQVGKRLIHVSQPFVGAPYQLSPLGEGAGIDPDPRLRFDAFDCTTFVETSIALTLADNLDEARALLDILRYRNGETHFLERRHFPAAEWIPELTRLGFLRDVTNYVGKNDVVIERKTLNSKVWAKRKKPTLLDLPDERIPVGTFALPVLPLDKIKPHMRRIPNGTVLNLVRVNFKTVPVRVSHQGIVIVKNGQHYLRHAADRMYHSVVDEPLEQFIDRMSGYRRWPVAGIHLSRIVEPADWRKLLRSSPVPPQTEWVSAPAYGDGTTQMTIDPALLDPDRCMEAAHAMCDADVPSP